MSLDAFIASCVELPVSDDPGPRRVLKGLRRIGAEQANADVRLATGFAAEQIRSSGCGAWAVARITEPVLVVPHDEQSEPEMIWHIARLLSGVRNAPLNLDPLHYAIVYGTDIPDDCWPADHENDVILDNGARALLLSMGVNEAAANLYWRPVCG